MIVVPRKSNGFTIVELLIVIVVIGILAAITIVAYNGIQQRARAASASAAVAQAAKKLALYQVDNNGYPNTGSLAAAGITDTQDVTYQYTGSGSSFCVTATSGNVSYQITDTSNPTAGGCPGHGQGGVTPITNLVTNPSLETNTTSWASTYGTGGAGTTTRPTDGGYTGPSYIRQTWTTAPNTSTNGGAWVQNTTNGSTAAGVTYTASAYVRSSKAQRMVVTIYWIDAAGAAISTLSGTQQVVAPNTWTRLTSSGVAPAGTVRFFVVPWSTGGTGYVAWAVGDTLDTDSVMFTATATPPSYADGSSTNWVWNGPAHSATSTGPPS